MTSTVSGIPQKLNVVVYAASLPARRHTRLDVLYLNITTATIIVLYSIALAHHRALWDYAKASCISSNTVAVRIASSSACPSVTKTGPCRGLNRDTGSIWV